jgi:hypothetical protein
VTRATLLTQPAAPRTTGRNASRVRAQAEPLVAELISTGCAGAAAPHHDDGHALPHTR